MSFLDEIRGALDKAGAWLDDLGEEADQKIKDTIDSVESFFEAHQKDAEPIEVDWEFLDKIKAKLNDADMYLSAKGDAADQHVKEAVKELNEWFEKNFPADK